MTDPGNARLPTGFAIRIRESVRRLDGGGVLIGGSPLVSLRLSATARALVMGDELEVRDSTSAMLAARLLDANIADPLPAAGEVDPARLTVVVPIQDRPEQLDACLGALRPDLDVVVVDDASLDPEAVRRVAIRHGARYLPLSTNVGPAGARNAGLRLVTSDYVAFVDSDVTVTADALLGLARHLEDPRVALIGPLVRGRSRSHHPRWFERYDEHAASLALGRTPCSVRPGATVAWLPSACLVARTSAVADGFDPSMRVGEDVDLVWRLVAAGWRVRYDPSFEAAHDTRSTVRSWLGRKFAYGTGGGALGQRHGDMVAPAVLSLGFAVAAGSLLLRRWWSGPLAAALLVRGAVQVARSLPPVQGRRTTAAELAVTGLGWSLRQEAALLLRHWAPPVLIAMPFSRQLRRAVATALVVDWVVSRAEHPDTALLAGIVARRLDDLAYGTGLWTGAIQARSLSALRPRPTQRRSPRGPALDGVGRAARTSS